MVALLRTIISAFVRNPVFANLLAVGLVVSGALAARRLPRETFPEMSLDRVKITVPYPGATPVDVEQGVCIKVEQAIEGIDGIYEIASVSSDNVGLVVAAFDPGATTTGELLRQIQNHVNAINSFPPEAEEPVITEAVIQNPAINIAVYGDAPERTIKEIAEAIRRDLMAHPDISQVSLTGVREYEISIRLEEPVLRRYGLSLDRVIAAISESSLDLPAGTLRGKHEEISVRTIGQRYTAQDFEDLPVIERPDGISVRLGQLAQIRDAFEESPVLGRFNGQPGAMIVVSKTAQEDTTKVAKAVRDFVATRQAELPEGISLSIWSDTARDIESRLSMLVGNGLLGMALVLVCLLLFLDGRSAVAVAIGIPVSFAGAFAVLLVTDGTINMVTLLGLLMATGIIVDDAIVIAESVRARRRAEVEPLEATIDGTHRVARPVLTSSLTTIITFVPLMYVDGVMGRFIYLLPVVVIAAIVSSAIEAFVILPSHLYEWSRHRLGTTARSLWQRVRLGLDNAIDRFIGSFYRPILRSAMRRRAVVLGGCVGAVLFCGGLVIGGQVPFVLFPELDVNTLRARVRFPEGMPASASRAAVKQIETAAWTLNNNPALPVAAEGPLVRQAYSLVGEWGGFVPKRGNALGEVSIELMPSEDRHLDCTRVIDQWRQAIGPIPDAISLTIARQQLRPGDKPIEITLLGDDLEALSAISDEVSARLASFDGVTDIESDLIPGKRELQVSLKPEAIGLGISVADLASQLRQSLYGGEAVRLIRGSEEIRAVVSLADESRHNLSDMENLRIRSKTGAEVPFLEVADTTITRGYMTIGRQHGKRRVIVRANVDERIGNAEQIVQTLDAGLLPELTRRHAGFSYGLEGQRRHLRESMTSLYEAFAVAMIAMYVLLGAVLRSYTQPMAIMVAIPLGMVGAILGHAVLGYSLTLMSVFGMVALAGIVVNDSLVLIDGINRNLTARLSLSESVLQAGVSRFRAVVLTTITTTAGLFPLLAERSSQAQSLIPMAVSITFGLMAATVLTLVIVPCLFVMINDVKRAARWLRHGGSLPSAEEVEPTVVAVETPSV